MTSKQFYIILFSCIVVYIIGMFSIPLMDIDAAQYASISREMLERKSFLQIYDLGQDYLDKPPMLFWLSAASMSVLGTHDWAYRLPSFLFGLLAIYSTYRLALVFYKKEIARLSALVLAASQAMFLINHDVRTDTMLMGWVSFSIWHLAAWYATGKWKNFVLACIGLAGGMLTKGPIALVVPILAFVPHFILKRQWKQFFRWEYILGILIIAAALIPMSIGLYRQFDLHPGKIINHVPIQSGLKFYYWTQSFGRYTGENAFKEMNDFTFLLQNMLWSFLPWIIFFLVALFIKVIDVIRNRFLLAQKDEFVAAGGFILTYCVLGRSQAQLPHYIFVAFPLAAIVTADFLYKLFFEDKNKTLRKILTVFHYSVFLLLWIALIVLLWWPFESLRPYAALIALPAFCTYIVLLIYRKLKWPRLLAAACFTVISINALLNIFFYPTLLTYQKGSSVAMFINEHNIDKNKVVQLDENIGHSFHFYSGHIYPVAAGATLQKGEIVVMKVDSVNKVRAVFPQSEIIARFKTYPVTQLSLPFLNPALREKEIEQYILMKIH